jgi:predicted nucleic acid-binding protein
MYVLDTMVVSALRVAGRNSVVEAWAARIRAGDQYVAAPTIAEIELGVAAMERRDPRQGAVLRSWFEDRVLPAFSKRVLSFDLSAARVMGTYRVPEVAPADDALIAAVAQANNMVVATRNTAHFEPLGVRWVNPWDQSTWDKYAPSPN